MQVVISSQHIQIHHNVHEYVESKLQTIVTKYFEQAINSHVNFVENNKIVECSISVNDGVKKHLLLFAHSSSDDIYTSFDLALAKVNKQLKKYKSKIKKHHHNIKASLLEDSQDATKYILKPIEDEEVEGFLEANEVENNPAIIEERNIQINSLTVSEAVMRMDLESLPALMFKNSKTGKMNIVYYRKDGNIAWIEAKI